MVNLVEMFLGSNNNRQLLQIEEYGDPSDEQLLQMKNMYHQYGHTP
jgi:hypothetical protein